VTEIEIAYMIDKSRWREGFGAEAAQNQIFEQLRGIAGDAAATVIQNAVKAAAKPSTSIWATALGIFTLIFGATGVYMSVARSTEETT
jgi:membrane protein